VILGLILLYFGCIVVKVVWIVRAGNQAMNAKVVRLLQRTDHQKLLDECDQLWADRAKLRPDPNWHPASREHPDPGDPLIPPIIAGLQPGYITISENYVAIELGGGFGHATIYATQSSHPPPIPTTRQLLPRLLFYSEAELPAVAATRPS
jgi:hypothetical protein